LGALLNPFQRDDWVQTLNWRREPVDEGRVQEALEGDLTSQGEPYCLVEVPGEVLVRHVNVSYLGLLHRP
jgi:hypothetical protein